MQNKELWSTYNWSEIIFFHQLQGWLIAICKVFLVGTINVASGYWPYRMDDICKCKRNENRISEALFTFHTAGALFILDISVGA